ncbi:MAG TPA: D-2-hydroxyacid dehydrogenase [Ktedonobacteraceae bacterium]|jgi:phosphoglycerate dehydrogenase-like enzyme|nr:D-2-hydroxyacid dehydrogenase [Ktedonobacteraceae bacterium]
MAEALKVVAHYQFTPESLAMLSEAARSNVVRVNSYEEQLRAMAEAEVLCSFDFPNNWREVAPHLRWYQSVSAGVDRLRGNSVLDPDSGVIVTTASGVHSEIICEYVFCSILMFNRGWHTMVDLQRRHIWAHESPEYPLPGRELTGRTMGIVGLGNIGRRIAQVAHAFGMKVLAMRFSTRGSEPDPDVDQSYPVEQLRSMLALCDYVVLSMPLTGRTAKMIGEAELRAMRPDAYLVNIARGGVVDEPALIRALQEGWIAGAGLDVTDPEPPRNDSPLYDLPNVILTPHVAGATEHYERRLAELFADNLRRYRAGQPLRNQYDARRGY